MAEELLSLKPPQDIKDISYTEIKARHELKSKARMNELLEEKKKIEIEDEIKPIKKVYHENYEKPDHSHPIWNENGELVVKENKKPKVCIEKEKLSQKIVLEASVRLYNSSLKNNKNQATESDSSTESKTYKYSHSDLDEFLQRNELCNKRKLQKQSDIDDHDSVQRFCSPVSSRYIKGQYVSLEKRSTTIRSEYPLSDFDPEPDTQKITNPTGLFERCMERSINLQAKREAINLNKQAEEIKNSGHLEKMTSEKKTKKLADNARKRKQAQLEAKENEVLNQKQGNKPSKAKHARPKTVTSVSRMLSLFREEE